MNRALIGIDTFVRRVGERLIITRRSGRYGVALLVGDLLYLRWIEPEYETELKALWAARQTIDFVRPFDADLALAVDESICETLVKKRLA